MRVDYKVLQSSLGRNHGDDTALLSLADWLAEACKTAFSLIVIKWNRLLCGRTYTTYCSFETTNKKQMNSSDTETI